MFGTVVNNTEQVVRRRKMASKLTEEQSSEDELYSVDPGAPLLEENNADELKEVEDRPDVEVVQTSGEESSWMIALQVFGPFIIAGFGTVGAGMVLDIVQHWQVFKTVPEVFILVPALLGLKGNLEMTLASRLSTQANLGNMDSRKEQLKMIGGNLALTQAQAIVVGFLASVAAMVMGWIPEGKFNIHHGFLLCASSMLTASLASLILGSIMIGVVMLSRHCKINPDNVATPVAASLGDLTTLTLLALIGRSLFIAIEGHSWVAPSIIGGFTLLTPLWVVISVKNEYTNDVIYSGWTPVISAMVISSIGGLILDFAVSAYDGIAVFQPVINGVGGNLVAVQASRISTSLHKGGKPGELSDGVLKGCPNPCFAFFGSTVHARAARVLMLLVIPGHLIFMYTIAYMNAGHTAITLNFAVIYLTAAVLQVAILLYVANWIVHYIWKKGDDPDNSAIPYLTALGDLLGTGFLAIVFQILCMMGNKDKMTV
ncbi:solute carrier family 41 member 1-like [Liolophura sinensis]|uniref:solute carrier family 41 member 1-like n=1 Tax=Liolophura sinensis TaxID=3198878 RepID=UPI003158C3CE